MNQNLWHWFLLHINPEPWAIGDLSVGRRNGKAFPIVGRNNQLHNYKEAVREELQAQGDLPFFDGKIELRFFFWRTRDQYTTKKQSTARSHEADGTNLAKATEDALQGVLFANDKDVNDLHWTIVQQTPEIEPRVIIGIRAGQVIPDSALILPTAVMGMIENDNRQVAGNDNDWRGPGG